MLIKEKAMTIFEKMQSGDLYLPNDEAVLEEQMRYLDILYDFNQTRPSELSRRAEILHNLFAEIGDDCYIEPPLYANWGCHTHFGSHVYANFGLTLVDDGDVFVGDHVMFAPHVTLATAGHPVRPDLRRQGMQFNMPIHIGSNVWIGAGTVVLPGVSIGDNTVIGAGSVVTKDIPANVVAVGNPCRVMREIGEKDKLYYYKNRKIME